jgi:hypothetical protein
MRGMVDHNQSRKLPSGEVLTMISPGRFSVSDGSGLGLVLFKFQINNTEQLPAGIAYDVAKIALEAYWDGASAGAVIGKDELREQLRRLLGVKG